MKNEDLNGQTSDLILAMKLKIIMKIVIKTSLTKVR